MNRLPKHDVSILATKENKLLLSSDTDLKKSVLSERSQAHRPHTIWFYLHETSRTEMENTSIVALNWRWDLESTINGCEALSCRPVSVSLYRALIQTSRCPSCSNWVPVSSSPSDYLHQKQQISCEQPMLVVLAFLWGLGGGGANMVGIQENPGNWTYTSSWIITIGQDSLEKSGCLRWTLITDVASPWLRCLLDLLSGPFEVGVNISMKPQVFSCKEEIIWKSFLESLS